MDTFTIAAATLFAALLVILFKSSGKSSSRSKLPPSPGAFPVIGHLHLLGGLPHRSLFDLARQYGGLMHLRLGSVPTVVVSTPAYAKEVLRTHDHVFASRPLVQAAILFGTNFAWAPYEERYKSTRKLWKLEIFTSKRLEEFRPIRKLETGVLVSQILEACRKKVSVQLNTLLIDCTFNTVARMLMSTSYSSGDIEAENQAAKDFKDNLVKVARALIKIKVGETFPSLRWLNWPFMFKINRLMTRMHQYLETVIQRHKHMERPGEEPKDSMDVMLANGLDHKVIKGQLLDMCAAGMDTSAVTVEWALAELIKHPEAMEQAQEELDQLVGRERTLEEEDIPKLKYLQAVVKETLRLHPPAPLMIPHESMEACVIGGYALAPKTRVMINVFAIGRDPSVWENPDQFDPQRFLRGNGASIDLKGQNFELLPFGSGRRMCPGMMLGLTMVHFLLGTLLHSFDWHRADNGPGEELDMTEAFGVITPLKMPLVLLPSSRLL